MKKQNKPLIAVTGPKKIFSVGWWAIRFNLWLTGLRGIYLYPQGPTLDQPIDGLIISGGDDINPQHYGESEKEESEYDPGRDELELAILAKYLDSGIPILGICRGSQLLNIAANGSLYGDIRSARKKTPNKYTALPVKKVDLEKDSQLGACVEPKQFTVNSLHNQAIKTLGEGLIVTARDADGFIQAIEHKDRFIVGVQWHPEYMPYLSSQREIFHCFANAVNKRLIK
jgi:putative glutamine amidotransferase